MIISFSLALADFAHTNPSSLSSYDKNKPLYAWSADCPWMARRSFIFIWKDVWDLNTCTLTSWNTISHRSFAPIASEVAKSTPAASTETYLSYPDFKANQLASGGLMSVRISSGNGPSPERRRMNYKLATPWCQKGTSAGRKETPKSATAVAKSEASQPTQAVMESSYPKTSKAYLTRCMRRSSSKATIIQSHQIRVWFGFKSNDFADNMRNVGFMRKRPPATWKNPCIRCVLKNKMTKIFSPCSTISGSIDVDWSSDLSAPRFLPFFSESPSDADADAESPRRFFIPFNFNFPFFTRLYSSEDIFRCFDANNTKEIKIRSVQSIEPRPILVDAMSSSVCAVSPTRPLISRNQNLPPQVCMPEGENSNAQREAFVVLEFVDGFLEIEWLPFAEKKTIDARFSGTDRLLWTETRRRVEMNDRIRTRMATSIRLSIR